MNETVYALQKVGDKDEYHLFTCSITSEGSILEKRSICNQIDYNENHIVLSYLREDLARTKCANGGRSVCHHCVTHLYI